jgi:hypothetical protein
MRRNVINIKNIEKSEDKKYSALDENCNETLNISIIVINNSLSFPRNEALKTSSNFSFSSVCIDAISVFSSEQNT